METTRDLKNWNLVWKLILLFQVLEAGHFFQGLTVHGDVNTDLVCIVHHDLGLLCADFHAIYTDSCNESVREVLELIATAFHKVHVICKPEVSEWPVTNGDGGVVVVEDLLRSFFLEKAE